MEDVEAAISAGADAVGFIWVPESPRNVSQLSGLLEQVHRIPAFITSVVVARKLSEGLTVAKRFGFNVVQYYENDGIASGWPGIGVMPVVRLKSAKDVENLPTDVEPPTVLLDAWHEDRLGGTGEQVPPSIAKALRENIKSPIVLAGGLRPDNVASAIREMRPWGVDVSSGVELSPGIKDYDKMNWFIAEVTRADRGEEQ